MILLTLLEKNVSVYVSQDKTPKQIKIETFGRKLAKIFNDSCPSWTTHLIKNNAIITQNSQVSPGSIQKLRQNVPLNGKGSPWCAF